MVVILSIAVTTVNVVLYGSICYVGLGCLIRLLFTRVKDVMFLHRVRFPTKYLKTPNKLFKGASNFYVKSESGNTLGVWHIPPNDEVLPNATKVVFYVHGNALTRGSKNRLLLYKKLQKSGYHVVTYDYSGFADSSGSPCQSTVVLDTISIYRWMKSQLVNKDVLIIVHGHSLGTSISTQALTQLHETENIQDPLLLILEAPFTCAREAIQHYPLTRMILALYPFFRSTMHDMIEKHDIEMNTRLCIGKIKSHILILHAEDDNKVHYDLGYALYKQLENDQYKNSKSVTFFGFNKQYNLLHFPSNYNDYMELLESHLEHLPNLTEPKEVYF